MKIWKKLSEKKRDQLFDIIKEKAISWSVASVDEKTIDEINILQATYQAMKKAVEGLLVAAEAAEMEVPLAVAEEPVAPLQPVRKARCRRSKTRQPPLPPQP